MPLLSRSSMLAAITRLWLARNMVMVMVVVTSVVQIVAGPASQLVAGPGRRDGRRFAAGGARRAAPGSGARAHFGGDRGRWWSGWPG